ncbi:uncharacterized protein LOC111377388 [Olea europaea var. sylvestris]|uniref:uncharacterized protein LOC111377388 n=1 Tax=Olea europaea var. sylvestris TaxID=158386 RepID=UPI000C1D1869|nr:uncharacterized protein LOC111377388 [Olea europaea var. sylvestris]
MDKAAAVDIPVALGNTTPEVVGIIRSSTGTGNFSVQNRKTKPIPNYLRVRALTGSCHDFCKYGMRRHDVETKSEMYRPAKTAKSTLHKEKLVKKDTEKKVPTNTNSVSVSAKHPGDKKLKLLRTQTPGSTNRQNEGNKTSNSKLSRKTRVPPTSSSSKVPSLKSRNINIPKKVIKLENKKSEKKTTDYENVPEKTLYVIDESLSDNQKTDSRAEESRRMRNGHLDGSLRKLEFKERELLEIPSESKNCRVLKFRQAKTLNEIPNDEAKCKEKDLRKLVSDGSNGCSIGTDDKFSCVVLRPQAVGKKNTSPGLYNSLIKETASKLVQKRKSRVKALVGAFETVITLQEKSSCVKA